MEESIMELNKKIEMQEQLTKSAAMVMGKADLAEQEQNENNEMNGLGGELNELAEMDESFNGNGGAGIGGIGSEMQSRNGSMYE